LSSNTHVPDQDQQFIFFLQLHEVEKSHKSVKGRARESEDTPKCSSKNATQLQLTKEGKYFSMVMAFYKAIWKGKGHMM
jgi:hypothetical protein